MPSRQSYVPVLSGRGQKKWGHKWVADVSLFMRRSISDEKKRGEVEHG
jgi:hypothetical protein